jgi:hypothetical protein
MMIRPNPEKITNFGDYLDRLNAQASIADVEAHIGDWPNGRDYRDSLISYAMTHFASESILCRWAHWARSQQ